MKAQFMLKPLAFALAAVLSAGVYADQGGDRNRGPQNGGNASIVDSQNNHNNLVRNEGTVNDASIEGSLGGASGNVGVNVAAGDNNQQANAGAIAVADAYMVFGAAASATIDVDQTARNNTLRNFSVPNTASMVDSANGASGNVGVNIAAGNFNQQKNDMAIGVSETAYAANAGVNVSQVSNGNVTKNNATLDYGTAAVSLSMNGTGTYSGQSDQIGNVYPDIWTGDAHPAGSPDGHFDLDTATQGGSDLNEDGGALAFNEAGTLGLSGSVTGSIPVVAGFNTAVVNTASLTNSLNGVSGNVGVNIAAGGGNQQSNSLAVAVGCTACASQ
ncbi:hypothetical protein N1078_08725 [Pseudomonas sp. MIL19]|uniref:hypothetical protein n=1 Tax=Pseudomonas sp. MIL19 TaxID=2976979 RepID=UPI0023646F5A|nr:hypothetical protein [Pseudomonas sp. MIL19]MDD2160665.1 hypothetical protein [Pseudomonas sp. MIL19]